MASGNDQNYGDIEINSRISDIKYWHASVNQKQIISLLINNWNNMYIEQIKFSALCLMVRDNKYVNVKNILRRKSRQLRKYKMCGNAKCATQTKSSHRKYKMCSQCKITYYCCKMCQKIDWMHHKLSCLLFS
eukprot:50637_1